MMRSSVIAVRGIRAITVSATGFRTHVLVVQGSRLFSTSADKKSIGFIGLGNMGAHMANNLLKAGQKLVVYDLNQEAVARAEQNGARKAASPKEVAESSHVVITMLPSSPHVREVYLSEKSGILAGARKHSLFIDSSTIDPQTAQAVSAQALQRGHRMVDAPVSGGVGGAEKGTLTFMVGGAEDAFEAAHEVLKHMGKNIVHCGDAGTGQVAKIANNLVLAISMAGVCEGMNLGVKLGMDPKKLAGIFNTSTARCWSSDTYNPCPGVMENVPASRGYTGGFGVDLMRKDLGLALTAASAANANLPLGAVVSQLYNIHSSNGGGKLDFSSLFQFIAGQQNKSH